MVSMPVPITTKPIDLLVILPITMPKPNPADYYIEFDEEVKIDGKIVDVKVLYPSDCGEIDVFTLDEKGDGDRLVTDDISEAGYAKLHERAEKRSFEKEAEEDEVNYLDAMDRKCHEEIERKCFGE